MANPNIVNVATINANTAVLTVTTTAANIITNPAASNKVYKINALTVANGNTSSTANVSVDYQKAGIYYPLAGNVTVPSSATLVVISKDSSLYLLEGDSLRCNATSIVGMTAVVTFEEIS
jgi:hypothetical protein